MKVTVKSTPVRYDGGRYLKGETIEIKEEHFNEALFEAVEVDESEGGPSTDVDYSLFTEEELKKVKNDDLKAFLEGKQVEYPSSANKDELIKLVLEKE